MHSKHLVVQGLIKEATQNQALVVHIFSPSILEAEADSLHYVAIYKPLKL